MNWSRWRSRNRLLVGAATSAAAVALIAVGIPAAALATHTGSHARNGAAGPGYPPPGGIYAPFTNCPILNPLMQEGVSGSAVICSDGHVTSGSITIGNITTPVIEPVDVQFGGVQTPNANFGGDWTTGISSFAGGILPPPAGIGAMLSTKPDQIPGTLTQELGCATATDPVVVSLCTRAENGTAKDNKVFALAQSAGQLTNFGLTTWTQRLKFKLINPLLGNSCYIGNNNQPIVVNPNVTAAPGTSLEILPDPFPKKHPNTAVLAIPSAIATDNTFTAPGVTGCGPGGAKNIPVDEALDTGAGLPSASGVNSLTLNGSFAIADCYNTKNQANILLSAFADSVGTSAGTRASAHRIPFRQLHSELRHLGVK
jgi:hypothetical protein